MATKQSQAAAEAADTKGAQQGARIKWDDSAMKSSYANVCNVTSTREEVVMLFGINQAWNAGQKEVRSEERRVGKECRSRWSPYH